MNRTCQKILVAITVLTGLPHFASAGYADVTFSLSGGATNLFYRVLDEPVSVQQQILNETVVLQPGTYQMLINGTAQSQTPYAPAPLGRNAIADLNITFGPGISMPQGSGGNSRLIAAVQLVDQREDVFFAEYFDTIPFAKTFSASSSNGDDFSTASSRFSQEITGRTLRVRGVLSADTWRTSRASGFNNFGYGYFDTRFEFIVNETATISIQGLISTAPRGGS